MRIIGVDPGTLVTGYGIIERKGSRLSYVGGGCIHNRSGTPLPDRFLKIYRELKKVFESYTPDQMAVEGLFFCKNVKAALKLGEARGIAILVAAEKGVEVFEYAPRRVKQAVLGRGGAQKQQVQFMVKQILNMREEPRPADAADALALAVCHAHTTR
ncbi:MAG: crossover junction endodeoxyribonuclease RuvC [Candidatus Aureabacteria bacterium]|nr:crossover junction endodeoxyribonuclease RuvC [Candidatus Auribacterota bacterium]